MVRRQMWQAQRFEIFESARHFRIESGCLIRIESRSFAGPYCKTGRMSIGLSIRSVSTFSKP